MGPRQLREQWLKDSLQRPLPDGMLKIVASDEHEDPPLEAATPIATVASPLMDCVQAVVCLAQKQEA
jgi:hypothetical protein